MSWGFPPQVEEILSTRQRPEELTKKILTAGIKLNWQVQVQDENYLYFTRKQQNKLIRFFLKNEKTDITVRIDDNGAIAMRSCGPNFIVDGGVNQKNIDQLKQELDL